MKKTLLTLFIGLILLGSLRGVGQSTPNSSPGRFQIFQGEYDAAGESTNLRLKSVFKFDTQTGQTWILVMGTNATTHTAISSWVPITN